MTYGTLRSRLGVQKARKLSFLFKQLNEYDDLEEKVKKKQLGDVWENNVFFWENSPLRSTLLFLLQFFINNIIISEIPIHSCLIII